MKSQGVSENEIVKQLQEQGVSPKIINDSFNQAQIKKAVSNENPETQNFEGLQTQSQQMPEETYTPQTQDISEQETYSQQPQTQQEEQYQGYPQEEAYEYSQTGVDTNTMIEISEQIFFEKIQKIQKNVEDLSEFKILAESKIENVSERIKKIETILDKMQIAILGKIGSYGSNLESIKKEMTMMQDSFGKIVNSVEEKNEKPKISQKKQNETFSKLKKISNKK